MTFFNVIAKFFSRGRNIEMNLVRQTPLSPPTQPTCVITQVTDSVANVRTHRSSNNSDSDIFGQKFTACFFF